MRQDVVILREQICDKTKVCAEKMRFSLLFSYETESIIDIFKKSRTFFNLNIYGIPFTGCLVEISFHKRISKKSMHLYLNI